MPTFTQEDPVVVVALERAALRGEQRPASPIRSAPTRAIIACRSLKA
jgi:hypothetical protein